ncbi:hypothetical protein N9N28_02860 [Rubripirellula amarantea]|nr:hypothetical protein [Rubripirellula amarantea]
MNCDLDTSIPDWIIEHPETSRIFLELELDTSCGGKSLSYLCIHKDLDPNIVLRHLRQVIAVSENGKRSLDGRAKRNFNATKDDSSDRF